MKLETSTMGKPRLTYYDRELLRLADERFRLRARQMVIESTIFSIRRQMGECQILLEQLDQIGGGN